MALVPFSYNLRSLFVRRSSTALTVLALGATVATIAGVLALQQGFQTLFTQAGRDDVVVFLRKGAVSEGESGFTREDTRYIVNSVTEIDKDSQGRPMAAIESFTAVRREKREGGETNVPIRGVQPMTFDLLGDRLRMIDGKRFQPGSDEVIVGKKLVNRIANCTVGATIQLNLTPCKVVGVFACEGPFESEIWGDLERVSESYERPVFNRVVARLSDMSADGIKAFASKMQSDVQSPCDVFTESAYLAKQTELLSGILIVMGSVLGFIMGIAAVFTATNTMLAAIASRTREIGILLATGFGSFAIFLSFLFESLVLALLGGIVGCLLALPINGIETGTSNFQTFTEVAFAFRVTPTVLVSSVVFALVLGVLAGAWPAWKAARLTPTEAMRRA